MPISSLVIRIDQLQRPAVEAAIRNLPMTELTPTPPGEILVVVLDTPSLNDEETLFQKINEMSGVRQVSLSYHNFEDLSETRLSN